jgi:uroporphyrinogen decarboxylase
VPEMTKEERVLCALSLEEPDRVPLYDLVDNVAVIERYAGRKLTLENAAEVIPLALSRCLDTTRVWMPGALGTRVDERGFVHERRDWFNEWQVKAPFDDMPGLIAFVRRDIERLDAWQPDDGPGKVLKELTVWKQRYAGTVIPASTAGEALADAYIMVGLDRFVFLEVEEPVLTERWIEALHRRTMRRVQSESGCRAVSPVAWLFADLAYKGRLIFSPGYLRSRGVFTRLAEICELYHGYGLKVIFHSDGFIRPIIPDLLGAGVDALAPIETSAGMDLADLKAEFGDRVAFVGGVDLGVLTSGTVEEVRALTRRALAAAGRGGGFILGSSSEELYDAVPAENIIAMFETTWEYPKTD